MKCPFRMHPQHPILVHTSGMLISTRKRWKKSRIIGTRPKAGWRRGYPLVSVYREGRYQSRPVHQIVLEAFVGPCPPGMETRHLNGDYADNRVSNLRWGTKKQNSDDMRAHGNRPTGSRHGRSKLNESQVLEIRKRRANGENAEAVAASFSIRSEQVYRIERGTQWSNIP